MWALRSWNKKPFTVIPWNKKCFINYFTLCFLCQSPPEAALLCLQCDSSTVGQRGETDAGSFPACGPCWGIWGQPHLCWSDGGVGTIQDWTSHSGTSMFCAINCCLHYQCLWVALRPALCLNPPYRLNLQIKSPHPSLTMKLLFCSIIVRKKIYFSSHGINYLFSSVFPQEMWDQEKKHLQKFNEILADSRVRPTALLPFWNIAGFALGLYTF